MPAPITSEYGRLEASVRTSFKSFYFLLLPFALHWSFVVYINSTYLEQFFSRQSISILYIVGSLITLISFLSISKLLNRIGKVRFVVGLTILELCALVGLAFCTSAYLAVPIFIIHLVVCPIMLFSLDLLLEGLIGPEEGTTGGRRGLFLTIGSLTAALATLCMGYVLGDGVPNFTLAYLTSAGLLIIFLLFFIRNFGTYVSLPIVSRFKAIESIHCFWHEKDIRNVFFAYFLLQIFFAWSVIYAPAYLATELGYNWEQIGQILFVGLLAYVLLEYIIGFLADTYFGEKEMMALGFMVMAVAISWCVFLDNTSLYDWMILMFMIRVGASLVETTTESYFFKHVKEKDISTIGVFRIAQPLAYILGPVLGGVLLFFFPFSFTFVILGALMIPGLFFAMALHDTR